MRVQFLKDHDQYEDGNPMYQKGEIAHILEDVAIKWISDGVCEEV